MNRDISSDEAVAEERTETTQQKKQIAGVAEGRIAHGERQQEEDKLSKLAIDEPAGRGDELTGEEGELDKQAMKEPQEGVGVCNSKDEEYSQCNDDDGDEEDEDFRPAKRLKPLAPAISEACGCA